MRNRCGHAYSGHWLQTNKCAVNDCLCPGYEELYEEMT